MTYAPIVEPPAAASLRCDAAAGWCAWCFALAARDAKARLVQAVYAGRLPVWRGEGEAARPVPADEVAAWDRPQHVPPRWPPEVFDAATAGLVRVQGPLRLRWGEVRAVMAGELHERAPPLDAEKAAALAADRPGVWMAPQRSVPGHGPQPFHSPLYARLRPGFAPDPPPGEWEFLCLVTVALALGMVPVATLRDGAPVPVILDPWEGYALPGAVGNDDRGRVESEMRTVERMLFSAQHEPPVLRILPWAAGTPGSAAADSVGQAGSGREVVGPPLHAPHLLVALKQLMAKPPLCAARGIVVPALPGPAPVAGPVPQSSGDLVQDVIDFATRHAEAHGKPPSRKDMVGFLMRGLYVKKEVAFRVMMDPRLARFKTRPGRPRGPQN